MYLACFADLAILIYGGGGCGYCDVDDGILFGLVDWFVWYKEDRNNNNNNQIVYVFY